MLINAIVNQEPELPRKRNPRISEGLESVVWKALRKNRADRYQSVGELEHDLERLTAGISHQTRLSRRVRHRLLLWVAPVLIVQAGDLSTAEKDFQAALDIWRAMGSPERRSHSPYQHRRHAYGFGEDRGRQEGLSGVSGDFPQER
jgi:serine/threonine protein kinase